MSPDLAAMWPDIERLNRWMNATAAVCETMARCGGQNAVTTTAEGLRVCEDCAEAEARLNRR